MKLRMMILQLIGASLRAKVLTGKAMRLQRIPRGLFSEAQRFRVEEETRHQEKHVADTGRHETMDYPSKRKRTVLGSGGDAPVSRWIM